MDVSFQCWDQLVRFSKHCDLLHEIVKIDNFSAFDICGPAGASQAIGCLLGLCSIPLTFGPQIAGETLYHLLAHRKKYEKN